MSLPSLNALRRRWLNFWSLEYAPTELAEALWQRVRPPARPPSPLQKGAGGLSALSTHPYTWQPTRLYFDQILVISLPFRTDRRARVAAQMQELGLAYRFLDATYGPQLTANQLADQFTARARRYLPAGSLGCAVSHAAAWTEVVRAGKICLILEDDVVLPDNFVETVRANFPQVPPDFDLAWLGSGLATAAHARRFVAPRVFEPFYPREGLYAYAVSARGAQRLLDQVFPLDLANGGVDTVVGKLVRKHQIRGYHLCPALCHADLTSPSNVPNPGGRAKVLDTQSERQLGEIN